MKRVNVGFVLLSNSARPLPSTRIAAINIFPFLRAAGFEPCIVFEPEDGSETPDVTALSARLIRERCDIVIFQKVHGPSVERLMRELSAAGVKTVYCVCDLVDVAMADAADATLVVTDYLKSLYPAPLQSKVHVIHDGIEDPALCKSCWSDDRGSPSRPLRAVLITSSRLVRLAQIGIPPPWMEVTIVGRYPGPQSVVKRARAALRTIADQQGGTDRLGCLQFMLARGIRCVPWSPERVRELLQTADMGVIPIDDSAPRLPSDLPPDWKRKSENRLTLKMSAALPVIATPIPSYEPIIDHGVNGFFARSRGDWLACFEALRDPELRQRIGRRARAAVADKYSTEEQSRKLTRVLRELVRAPEVEIP